MCGYAFGILMPYQKAPVHYIVQCQIGPDIPLFVQVDLLILFYLAMWLELCYQTPPLVCFHFHLQATISCEHGELLFAEIQL